MATRVPRPLGRLHGERGAGAVLAVALIAASLAFAIALVQVFAALSAHQRVQAAADAAALAAADTLSGRVSGDPCGRATELATANGASVRSCELDGVEALVVVDLSAGWVTVSAAALAGPAPALRS
ncbi:Rv3654c family TadE-like protein [Pseudoclavibacter endophyticus]|uniref:Rv3654c family TadE-like protein n=1 Tax=Pseudoclavibacter endophyticus TaxID=1778590 RepID=UPI001667FE99|nr:Rv3654c family TadE-like protein [Pseudoclavibacter endophyticus]